MKQITIQIRCTAPLSVFSEAYEDIPAPHRLIIEYMGALPCDGEGGLGLWCGRCRWGDVLDEEVLLEEDYFGATIET